MSLTVEISDSLNNAKREGYKITGIRLTTNLRVNKRQVEITITKRILDFLSSTFNHALRREVGKTEELDQVMVVVPVKSTKFYSTRDLDEQTSKVRSLLCKRYKLIADVKRRQFFIKLTLISSNGINQYQTQLLSYVSDKSDYICLVYYDLHSKLVHYDNDSHVIPLLAADKATPLLDVIDIINTD